MKNKSIFMMISVLTLLILTTAMSYNAVAFASPAAQPTAALPDISVYLDGQPLTFDVQPQIINGRTVVPLRAIFEAMGAKVNWDGDTQTVTAIEGNKTVKLTIGNIYPTIDGQITVIDQPGIIVNGRTLAPLRFVAEAFGGTVDWDATTRTVSIIAAKVTISTPPAEEMIFSFDGAYDELLSLGSKLNLDAIEETRWVFGIHGNTMNGELDKDINTKCGPLRVTKRDNTSVYGRQSHLVFSINSAELALAVDTDYMEDEPLGNMDIYVLDLCTDDPYVYVFLINSYSNVNGYSAIYRYNGYDWVLYMEFPMSTKLAYYDTKGKLYFLYYEGYHINGKYDTGYSIAVADVTNRTIQMKDKV